MSGKLVIISLVILLASGLAAAQNSPAITAMPNTVYVSAEGKFESAPDTAVVQFNISAQEELSKAAYDRASQEAEQVRQILRSNGIDPKTAEIGFFAIQPVYDWRQPKRRLVGYQVQTNVTLKLKELSKVGPIVQALGDQGFNENVNLSYTLDNIDAAKLKAIADAFQRAHAEAAEVARLGARGLGDLIYSSVDTYEQPHVVPMMMRAEAGVALAQAPTAEFSAQKVAITARVNALFGMK